MRVERVHAKNVLIKTAHENCKIGFIIRALQKATIEKPIQEVQLPLLSMCPGFLTTRFSYKEPLYKEPTRQLKELVLHSFMWCYLFAAGQ